MTAEQLRETLVERGLDVASVVQQGERVIVYMAVGNTQHVGGQARAVIGQVPGVRSVAYAPVTPPVYLVDLL